MKSTLEWQHEHIANGLCRLCSNPIHIGSKSYCYTHVLKNRARTRGRQGNKPKRKGKPGRPMIPRKPVEPPINPDVLFASMLFSRLSKSDLAQ